MNWYLDVIKNKYATFTGRARRMEYWYFALFNVIVSVCLAVVDSVLGMQMMAGVGLLQGLYGLAVLLPALAVSVRRLHDTGRSGWWLLIALLPIIGGIVILIFMVLDSNPGANRYGPNPKGATA